MTRDAAETDRENWAAHLDGPGHIGPDEGDGAETDAEIDAEIAALEEQMCRMTVQGYMGKGSPDRVDALVWALTELIVDPSQAFVAPRLRTLG
jgi:hypothetical protein